MNEFTATHFRFEVEATTPLALADYTGSALRGALVTALRRHFCPAQGDADAAHRAVCPVCWLLTYETTPGESRRPYAIEPLLGQQRTFQPGQRFRFGLTLFGQAINLFPYLVLAVPEMGRTGIGRKLDDGRGRWRRGRFALRSIEEVNPVSGQRATLMEAGERTIQMPQCPVTWAQVQEAAERLGRLLAERDQRLGIRFLTPTRIVRHKKLVHKPEFRPLFQRLLERVHELQRAFGGEEPEIDWHGLLALADQVTLVEDDTAWWDLQGRSSRLGREQQLGGFIGLAWYAAPIQTWKPLLPWLIWGMSTHVGKNAVKGSGWYSLRVKE